MCYHCLMFAWHYIPSISSPNSFMDIKLQEDGGIPTLSFLDACRAILPIFGGFPYLRHTNLFDILLLNVLIHPWYFFYAPDKLNHTAFAPVKLDVAGNIRVSMLPIC